MSNSPSPHSPMSIKFSIEVRWFGEFDTHSTLKARSVEKNNE